VTPIPRQTIASMTVAALRERILRGDYPEGEPLRQDALAEELGVSRIPVREALRQLEAEGLVTFSPHRGAVVSTLSLDDVLEMLERTVLRSPRLQRFVIATHERAMFALLADVPRPAQVMIVGGGLFPRTALILRRLLPEARLTVVEAKAGHIAIARRLLGETVVFHHAVYDPHRPPAEADLVVVPLAFDGDREAFYTLRPAPLLLVHDWLWHRRGRGVAISWLLLKRLNLITR